MQIIPLFFWYPTTRKDLVAQIEAIETLEGKDIKPNLG